MEIEKEKNKMGDKRMILYVSGPIYTEPILKHESDLWRTQVKDYFSKRSIKFGGGETFIEILDPCRKKAIYDPKLFTPNEIIFRDMKDVERADIILANFHLIGKKLPIGTTMEIMHAWLLKKPIVVVSTDPRVVNHPWILAMSTRVFPEIQTACDYIIEFWTD